MDTPDAVTPDHVEPFFGLGQMLTRIAERQPGQIALIASGRSMTYSQLHSDSNRVAAALAESGVQQGDRVALLSQNRWEWIAAYYGVLKVGGVVSPLNVMLTPSEVSYILQDAGVTALLASSEKLVELGDKLAELADLRLVMSLDRAAGYLCVFDVVEGTEADTHPAHQSDPAALACIAYTSGTTGHPKGAMQSHRSLVLNAAYTASMHVRTAADVVVTALPAPHVYGSVVLNSTFMAGGCVVLHERFDPARVLKDIEKYGATMFEGVPAMYSMLLADPTVNGTDLSSITRCTVGGQTIAVSLLQEWENLSNAPLLEVWGMTELSGLATSHALHAPNVHGSIGVSYPGVELRVAPAHDSNGECGPGDRGELMVRGPLVMLGYFGRPEATAEAITATGWLRTGDIATHDGSGRYFVVDRLKDVILTGGYNVYPSEIERVLIGHEAVALAGVAPQADPIRGEVAHAYVVLAPGHTPDADALMAHCREFLAAYKVPRAVHFVGSLPMTSSGKLMRRKFDEIVAS
ncbi:MAG TPA: AMP-binding protein [Nocardioides sp.]|uniref:class I adenylate-forming enzyme family protein n=1 Tax=uncultured Nocardioides sp. TaxID=198441 RepID=UPI002608B4B6|nr:AMP-binding protein [uncultured Nocardioides sp.]HRI94642.1 AMP-binding protein [Nocardioides sp.]HRK44041.1 AMP-binding protein [Nocardioides sp.]